MKLLVKDSNRIRDHFKAIMRQSWDRKKKQDRLKAMAKGYCIEFPESSWEISGLYTNAKRGI